MKTKSILAAVGMVAAGILLTGCSMSPQVMADMVEQLPSRPASEVMVFDTDQSVPQGARPIGRVSVTDGAMTASSRCQFGNMLSLAVRKTAASGGNAFHIDSHRKVTFPSSCHRIWGTAYVLPDSLVSGDAPSAISRIEEKYDNQLLASMNQQASQDTKTKTKTKTFSTPSNIIKVNLGLSWVLSEMQVLNTNKTYKNEMGFVLGVDFQLVWRSGLGFGINYIYLSTSFDKGMDIKMHYIGPSLVYNYWFRKNWRMDWSIGLGYAHYNETANASSSGSESNLGTYGQWGIEYRITENVGLGLQANWFMMKMKRPSGVDTSKYDFYGIKRLDTGLGLRFYF